MPSERDSRDVCQKDPSNAKLVIRARERQWKWGSAQILECRDCGSWWSQ